jgi:Flp pilus assembly pilin Flp
MTEIKAFLMEEDAVAVVEIVLLVLIGVTLAVLFKKQITSLVKNVLSKITSQGNSI